MKDVNYKLDNTTPKVVKDLEEVIEVPEKIATFSDKRTGIKTVSFPVTFPDGVNGILSITHLSTLPWIPSQDMSQIIIKYK